jgi:hypothetical protein
MSKSILRFVEKMSPTSRVSVPWTDMFEGAV